MTSEPVEAPTRREVIEGGGALIGGGLLAGCAGESTPSSGANSSNGSSGGRSTTSSSNSWKVTMQPAGTRTFSEVPDSFTVYSNGWADIAASLGQLDGLVGMASPEDFLVDFYNRLPGVSLNTSGITALYPSGADSADKELFYELNPAINLIDPYLAADWGLGLGEADVTEIEENVAPFFGSYLRRPAPEWTDGHPYYTLYGGIEKAAAIFREETRFRELSALHDSTITEVTTNLPAEREQLRFAYMNHNVWENGEEFYPRVAVRPGYEHKVFRDLGLANATNVFREQIGDETSITVSAEALFEADPDVIIYQSGLVLVGGGDIGGEQYQFEDDVVGAFESDPVLSEVTAVQNGRILPGPPMEQGPVTNFFSTEILAKALYPDQFGEYVGLKEPPDGEKLFDRKRLADIIKGDP